MSDEISVSLAHRVVEIVGSVGDNVKVIAHEGGAIDHRRKTSLGDLVTALDTSAESQLKRELAPLVNDASFIGEESGADDRSRRLIWILDPIDGTTNVVHGVEYAAVSVALVRDGSPVLGVVHDIYRAVTYFAVAGRGAFVVDRHGGDPTPLATSSVSRLAESLVSFGLPYDRDKSGAIFAAAARVLSTSQDLRRQGSAALDVVGVAAGRLEAHFELDLRVWDVAAASIILTESGGVLTDWDRMPVSFGEASTRIAVLASNGDVHAEMARTLADV